MQAMLIFSHDFHPLPKERVDELAELAERAREIFGKAVKTEVSSDGLSHLSRLARARSTRGRRTTCGARCAPRIHEWAPEIPRRVAALARLALRDDAAKRKVRAEPGVVDGLRRAMVLPGDSKARRAVANALIALDVHEQVLENITANVEKLLDEIGRVPEHAKAFEARRAEFRRVADETLAALKRDARTVVDISKQDPDHVGTLMLASAADTLVHELLLPERMAGVSRVFDDVRPVLGLAAGVFAAYKRQACHALTVMLSHAEDRATHRPAVADAGAIKALVRIMNCGSPPPASSGISADSRRYAESASRGVATSRAAPPTRLAKLRQDRGAYQMKVRDEDGVSTLARALDRRDPKVQRAAAAALLAMGEHERLVKEIERNTETLVGGAATRTARGDALKSAVRTLAELAKEGANATAEGDMVDAVVRSGAVEAIVPLLTEPARRGGV